MENLYQLDVYKELEELAIEQKYKLEVFTFTNESSQLGKSVGIHQVDEGEQSIRIGISQDYSTDIAIGVHELLHAKLYLLGFPKIRSFPKANFSAGSKFAITEIENISQHTLVYPEMQRLGYSQREHDLRFFEGIQKENNKVFKGVEKIGRALRLLECYLRVPELFEKIDEEISEKQKEEYALYRRLRRHLKNTGAPKLMRQAMGKLLIEIDEFSRTELDQDLYLRYLNSLDPMFTEYELKQSADKLVYSLKFNEFPDLFLINKQDDVCLSFINGSSLSQQALDSIIAEKTLQEIIPH